MPETKTKKSGSFIIKKLSSKEAIKNAETIVSIYRDCWLDTYPNESLGITKTDIEEKFKDLNLLTEKWKKKRLIGEDRMVWVASDKKIMVGFCVARRGKNENELVYLYIFPQYQGKHIGSKLMGLAMDWMGVEKPIILYGALYNSRAIHFYEKFGFNLTQKPVPPKTLPNGKSIPSMRMIRTTHT